MSIGQTVLKSRTWATAAVVACALLLAACGGSSSTGSTKVGVALILKNFTNPFFVSMQNDAKTEAGKVGVSLTVSAGTKDGDTATQITSIENAISAGNKGILITPNGPGVNAAIKKARDAGLYVIALDTPPDPPSTVDITFATDNLQAGVLIGKWAAAQLLGKKATIAMLDLFNNQIVSVDVNRDHGFLQGMGINVGDTAKNGGEAATGQYTGATGGGAGTATVTRRFLKSRHRRNRLPSTNERMHSCLN